MWSNYSRYVGGSQNCHFTKSVSPLDTSGREMLSLFSQKLLNTDHSWAVAIIYYNNSVFRNDNKLYNSRYTKYFRITIHHKVLVLSIQVLVLSIESSIFMAFPLKM